jgi:hypothetical protein
MTIIIRDMMIGNPKLAKMGFGEEALGHNAIASGFQDNAIGPTICQTVTLQKLCSIHPSTGTESDRPLW